VFSYETEDGWAHPPMASKMVDIPLAEGQAVRLETPGGGGYGPARERDPAAIARDVAAGLLSTEGARAAYGDAWMETGA